MMQKAASLYDSGDDMGAAEAANMAKYAAAEAATRSVDQAVQSMGGNGLTKEYGVAADAGLCPAGADRPDQPRDGAELRGADIAWPAPVLLMDTLVEYVGPADSGGPFARLTLNSPHNRNALSTALVNQLAPGAA